MRDYKLGEVTLNYDNQRVPLSEKERKKIPGVYRYYGAQEVVDYIDKYIFDGEYILVAEDGNNLISKKKPLCTLVTGKFWVNNHAHIIKANEKADTKYLYYLLNKINVKGYITGSAQPKLNQENLNKIKLKLPEKSIQEEIANKIFFLDKKIALNFKQLEKLDEYLYLLYYKWFIDFNFPNVHGKAYKEHGGELKEIEGKKLPPGWTISNLSSLGEIVSGGTPSRANQDYFDSNGIAWITPKDLAISRYKYIKKGETSITELGLKNSSANLLPKGTILMSSRAPIGYLAIAKNDVTTNQGFKSIVPKDSIGTEFVYYTLKRLGTKIENIGTGSTFKEVSKEMLSRLSVILPTTDVLNQFQVTTNPLSKKIQLLEDETDFIIESRELLIKKLIL
ncbi:restriction endonuclease subunit S [Planococcus sp. CPCC 101016]|uniref:restriction endonuclease subunit S n=1 Tax=Planococcus sp. CPCC 101016 TaxID=2599617 RepID=UPI0011B6D846|nr:restriction endonuclease subunit S [Planococcus sp. CPCC 101016]TWT08198.1 restriction endonuclease subunit S [Planococcus sp. CPCC 101016]